jgi:hypothetical protein
MIDDKYRAFRSVSDAADTAARMVSAHQPVFQIWRFAITQLLDDYQSVLQHEGAVAGARMWQDDPPPTGDVRVDAAFAALGEYLARRDGWPVPRWIRESRNEAVPWWFVTELRGMHPRALVESPSSFRRRGVFITRGALERA